MLALACLSERLFCHEVHAAISTRSHMCLENYQMLSFRSPHRFARQLGVESNKPAVVPHGQREKIDVGQLTRAMDAGRIGYLLIEQTDVICPEFMDAAGASGAQSLDDRPHRQCVWITWMRHDPDAAILRNRTRRPSGVCVFRKPGCGPDVKRVI